MHKHLFGVSKPSTTQMSAKIVRVGLRQFQACLKHRNLSKMSSLSMAPSSSRFHSTLSNGKQYDIQYIEEIRREFGAQPVGELKLNLDNSSGVATLCISNPQHKNCLSGYMMAQLTTVLDELHDWKEGKAVVIYGDEGFFCSGGDLNTVRTILNREGGRKMITLMQYNLHRLESLPLMTVAYVRGMSLGGGCEIMTACDYRLASAQARLGFVQTRMGISTVWGGGARLVRLIGYNRALHLIGTGRTFSAHEALGLGFVDQVAEEELEVTNNGPSEREFILAHATRFLQDFLAHPRHILLVAKQICNDTRFLHCNLNGSLAKELEHGLKIWAAPVHCNALVGKVNHLNHN